RGPDAVVPDLPLRAARQSAAGHTQDNGQGPQRCARIRQQRPGPTASGAGSWPKGAPHGSLGGVTSESPDTQSSAGEADVAPEAPTATNGDRVPMVEVIEHLLSNLDAAALPLDVPGADDARAERDRLATQVRHHLLPRLRQVAAPVIVVVGGSTGAGKSTIVNSVVTKEVTTSGVLRPTTRQPILVVHLKDADLLEGLPVTDSARVNPDEVVPRGMALLDAPDLDSVHAGNRGLADALVELADLWVFVTTGSRYGDAVPWSRLHSAHERGVSLAVVLNRVDPDALRTVRRDQIGRAHV